MALGESSGCTRERSPGRTYSGLVQDDRCEVSGLGGECAAVRGRAAFFACAGPARDVFGGSARRRGCGLRFGRAAAAARDPVRQPTCDGEIVAKPNSAAATLG